MAPQLRSRAWFGDGGKNGFIARHHLRAMGRGGHNFDGRPVVGICNTFSELTPCNGHLQIIADAVKRGVLQAGGFPLEFPAMSLGEPFLRPTSMLYRNLAAMEIEEQIRANPLDAVVLLTGCDKTTPAALMGAASAGVPAMVFTGGPMLNGRFQGRDVGSGTDIWRMTEELRAGTISQEEFTEFESSLNRSAGHCMTMGTASTMACLTEALGMMVPGGSGLPAVDARRGTLAEETGARAVELATSDLTPRRIMTREAFENAIRINAAIGGSTNAVVHLLAVAGRLGVPLALDDFDRLGAELPLLVDLMPSGRFLMEEFAYAGGLPALVNDLREYLHRDTVTVTGRSLLENCAGVAVYDREVIRPFDNPVLPAGSGTAVLRGNLAPDGAVIKQSAAAPQLLSHTGPALVFDSLEEYLAVAEDPDLDVTAETVLVVRNTGPRGYPGMPEVGNLALPKKLLDAGVRDMVRISDARMSGTAFGTCVLHVAPEAAVGGPLALVRTGDQVCLDVPGRRLDVLVDDAELELRRSGWRAPEPPVERGWTYLYTQHVTQADTGVDLDFLVGSTDSTPPRQAF
ncbi:dihydroxy-acid dehydratase [Streptomyces sp. NBC_01387]|uniref:IlvD/Edd family dehydratase n=1 Tax=unclassified Streptomyces TaxID=2593676 RepID=UPI002DD8C868|nr:IlvD/Edd family dehydratase [Streptomyces sp. NBC_01766]WSC19858.1 dihydroxy-acid dehydratase [Streptomyces sp. NBC_01766]WSV53878.1 dihydroxy-acid dehydratase [Streptomyces sp. NBC_01014]